MHGFQRSARIRGMGRSVIVPWAIALAIVAGCTPQDAPTGAVDGRPTTSPGVVMPRGASVDVGSAVGAAPLTSAASTSWPPLIVTLTGWAGSKPCGRWLAVTV